jgi:hypothetical protein
LLAAWNQRCYSIITLYFRHASVPTC